MTTAWHGTSSSCHSYVIMILIFGPFLRSWYNYTRSIYNIHLSHGSCLLEFCPGYYCWLSDWISKSCLNLILSFFGSSAGLLLFMWCFNPLRVRNSHQESICTIFYRLPLWVPVKHQPNTLSWLCSPFYPDLTWKKMSIDGRLHCEFQQNEG